MARNAKTIEVRAADGKLMFSLRIIDEAQGSGAQGNPGRNGRPANNQRSQSRQSHEGNGDRDGDAITDAQRRYLFRILADQGVEGDDALAQLKERLGVENLNNVTKREASNLIEELLANTAAA
jgi:hypothetical protein